MNSVRAKNVRLWAATLCKGGSPWNEKNYKRGSKKTTEKIQRHWDEMFLMWQRFIEVAEACLAYDPSNVVCMEWPDGCF